MRVLFIEDDEAISHLVVKVLEKKGHTVKHVGKLSDVKSAVSMFDPEVVITDLMLPDVDRHEFMNTLRKVVSFIDTDKVPVIVYSGAPMDIKECLDLGAMECLVKGDITPIHIPGVFDTVMARHALNQAMKKSVPRSASLAGMFDTIPNTDAMEEFRSSSAIDPDVVSANAHSLAEELRKLNE